MVSYIRVCICVCVCVYVYIRLQPVLMSSCRLYSLVAGNYEQEQKMTPVKSVITVPNFVKKTFFMYNPRSARIVILPTSGFFYV